MLIKRYRKHMSWGHCRAQEGCLQCMAYLDGDISEALPYLNGLLGGFLYVLNPPSVSFKLKGRIVVVYTTRIGISTVKDETEAEEILDFLVESINRMWERRSEIQPRFEAVQKPNVVEILRILQGADCTICGEPSCVAFAVQIAEGERQLEDCPALSEDKRQQLREYLHRLSEEGSP